MASEKPCSHRKIPAPFGVKVDDRAVCRCGEDCLVVARKVSFSHHWEQPAVCVMVDLMPFSEIARLPELVSPPLVTTK